MTIFRLIFLSSFLLITACSTTPQNSEIPGSNVQGLVGVSMNGTQNNANFNWYENDSAYHIELYGPLGMGSTYLDGNNQTVTLTLPSQDSYHASSPEILMQNVLGWSFPVEGLKYWLFAKPVPNEAFTATKDKKGHLLTLSQDGWNITYTWLKSQNFPHKIVLVRPNVKVTIVVNKIY